MAFVLDASVALSWFFADERTTLSQKLLEQLETEAAVVPPIWPLEMGNILISAERKKRISYADIVQALELLRNLNIETDNETTDKAFHEILFLAHSEGLTTYDTAYLEIAMRRGLPLASKDKVLCKVAERLGVQVLKEELTLSS